MTLQGAKDLVPKLAKDEGIAEEVKAFEEWIQTAPTEDVSMVMDLYYEQLPTNESFDQKNELVAKIEAELDLLDHQNQKNYSYKRLFIQLSVAATLVLLIASTYLYINKNRASTPVAVTKNTTVNDVKPGTYKATLQLSDGSIVTLNDANNSKIDKEKSVEIRKNNNELLYVGKEDGTVKEVAYNTLTTPRGGQFKVVLPDGTLAWLNAESSLVFPVKFTGNERNVTLKGEGYFEVAKNKEMPFNVLVNDMKVQVLGTHFNVMAYTDEKAYKTTLVEGSVKIEKGSAASVIKPGEMAIVSAQDLVVKQADIPHELAWKEGLFQFDKADIQTIMRQLARWYDLQVEYQGPVPNKRFVGQIRRSANLTQVLKILELSDIHFRVQGRKITVLA